MVEQLSRRGGCGEDGREERVLQHMIRDENDKGAGDDDGDKGGEKENNLQQC